MNASKEHFFKKLEGKIIRSVSIKKYDFKSGDQYQLMITAEAETIVLTFRDRENTFSLLQSDSKMLSEFLNEDFEMESENERQKRQENS